MSEWFDESRAGEAGLRFACTMCGNCCSGPEGYVGFTDEEGSRLAARLGVPYDQFLREYVPEPRGIRSLREREGPAGLDCIFLDRTGIPGRAVCSVYEDRPAQCRTWPFWRSNLTDERAWRRAARVCPGIGHGPLHAPEYIRVTRERVDI
jgi:uncharacterized protein